MKRLWPLGVAAFVSVSSLGCAGSPQQREAARVVQAHVAKVEPLTTQVNRVYWEATTTGKPEKFQELEQLQVQAKQVFTNLDDFNQIKALRESGRIRDPRLARQIEKLYLNYLQNRIESGLMERIVALDTKVQETFNNYRGTMDGQPITISDVYTIMTTEPNVAKRRAAGRPAGRSATSSSRTSSTWSGSATRPPGRPIRQLPHDDDRHGRAGREGPRPHLRRTGPADPRAVRPSQEGARRDPGRRLRRLARGPDALALPRSLLPENAAGLRAGPGSILQRPRRRGPGPQVLRGHRPAHRRDPGQERPVRREGKYPHAFSHDVDRCGDVRVLATSRTPNAGWRRSSTSWGTRSTTDTRT